jgi:hypothetical protein
MSGIGAVKLRFGIRAVKASGIGAVKVPAVGAAKVQSPGLGA